MLEESISHWFEGHSHFTYVPKMTWFKIILQVVPRAKLSSIVSNIHFSCTGPVIDRDELSWTARLDTDSRLGIVGVRSVMSRSLRQSGCW